MYVSPFVCGVLSLLPLRHPLREREVEGLIPGVVAVGGVLIWPVGKPPAS